MFELILLQNTDAAELVARTLRQRNIAVELRHQSGGCQLLVPGEQLVLARRLLQELQADPAQLNQAAWQDSRTAKQPVSFVGMSQGFRHFGRFTLLVTALCIGIYLSRYLLGDKLYLALLFPPHLQGLSVQPWRLFTPALLHFSILHISFDLIWWLDLGSLIERQQSTLRLLVITLIVAAVSNTAQFLVTGPLFGGMSGVVYGLLAYIWLSGVLRPSTGLHISTSVVVLLVGWLLLCWTGFLGNVANYAHLAGLLTGLALALVCLPLDKAGQSNTA